MFRWFQKMADAIFVAKVDRFNRKRSVPIADIWEARRAYVQYEAVAPESFGCDWKKARLLERIERHEAREREQMRRQRSCPWND